MGSADGSAVTRLEYSPAGEQIGPGSGAGSYAHDADADVDLDDFAAYVSCLGASAESTALCLAFHDANAVPARREADGDVDLEDFAGFQHCFSGSGQPPPPDCFRPAPEGVPPGPGSFALHGGMVDVLSSGREGPDDALALQYSRARYFDLTHGRFLQRDPTGYADGSNLYEAFASNPARFSDPMGTATSASFGLMLLHAIDYARYAHFRMQWAQNELECADLDELVHRFQLEIDVKQAPRRLLRQIGTTDDLTALSDEQVENVLRKEVEHLRGAVALLSAHAYPISDVVLRQGLDPDVYAMFGRQERRELSLGYVQGAAYAGEGATDIAIGLANQCLDLCVNQFVTALFPGAEIRIPNWRFAPEWIKVSDRTKEWSRFLGGNAILMLGTEGLMILRSGSAFAAAERTAAAPGGVLTPGARLRAQYGGRFGEYMHYRGQGFTPAQAKYLMEPYEGMGHHFIARRYGLPEFITESPLNVMRPAGISRGAMYERHFMADPRWFGTRFPEAIGGSWSGARIGLQKPGYFGRLWYASPGPLKATVGGSAAAGGAGLYWWLSDDQ